MLYGLIVLGRVLFLIGIVLFLILVAHTILEPIAEPIKTVGALCAVFMLLITIMGIFEIDLKKLIFPEFDPTPQSTISPTISPILPTALPLEVAVELVIVTREPAIPPTETPTIRSTTMPSTETPIPPTPELAAGATRFSEKDGMKMLFVEAGEFPMGSLDDEPLAKEHKHEKPQHRVYLDGFWIDETEVTNAMFKRFVEETGHETYAESEGDSYVYHSEGKWEKIVGANWRYPRGPKHDHGDIENHPVVHVSWNDARLYCEWAGRRLPTEAEWEKAARGSDEWLYPWGNQEAGGNLANYCDNNCLLKWADDNHDDGYRFTAPVGNYPYGASPVGPLDMAGNVWEWVADWYDATYYDNSPAENPLGSEIGEERVLRGGSWSTGAAWTRTAFRHHDPPADPNDERGFRCAANE